MVKEIANNIKYEYRWIRTKLGRVKINIIFFVILISIISVCHDKSH